MRQSKTKVRIYEILETATPQDNPSRIFDVFIVALIAINVLAVVLETVGALAVRHVSAFRLLELVSVAIFTLEYALRFWTCTANKRFGRPVMGRLRFALTALAIVDLLAILPFYIPMLITLDLRFLRVIRLVRIFRMFNLDFVQISCI